MNQLVTLTTQDISRAYPITNSLIIAEQFNKLHKNVLRDIRTLEEDLKDSLTAKDFNEYKIEPVRFIDKKGETRESYQLNESFFMMLVMGYNTKKALIIKNEFIKQFIFMKHELLMSQEKRYLGKPIRNNITKVVIETLPDGNFKKFAISNYTRIIYKKVLGMDIKKWKVLNGYPENAKARDYMSREELEQVQIYESKIADIIEFNTDEDPKVLYEKIKQFLNK